jgi:hypothetical protein
MSVLYLSRVTATAHPPRAIASSAPRGRHTGVPRDRGSSLARALVALAVVAAVACRDREAPRASEAAIALAADAAGVADVAADGTAIDAVEDAAVAEAAPPADAADAPTITKLVASGDSTCAVLSDLTVRCWGGNARGQLGNGETGDAARPVAPAIRAVVDLQLADATACALLDDASVACWGDIGWRGRGEKLARPTGVLGVIGVKQIFVVPGRACARVANDSLVCWGNVDARGHFVAGATHRAPTPVVGLDHIAGLTAAGAFSDDGRVWRWGSDGAPKRLDVAGVQEIAARAGTFCARLDGGRVVCADRGQCGGAASKTTSTDKPSAASSKPSAASSKPSAASSKPSAASRKPTTGAPKPAASNGEPVVSTALNSARQLAFDAGFCVVNTSGRLQCGDGCRKLDPIALERVDTFVGRCALLKSGTVSCFDGTKFVAVPALQRATLLAVGRAHACAVTGTRIACWGDNAHSQLGDFTITR